MMQVMDVQQDFGTKTVKTTYPGASHSAYSNPVFIE